MDLDNFREALFNGYDLTDIREISFLMFFC